MCLRKVDLLFKVFWRKISHKWHNMPVTTQQGRLLKDSLMSAENQITFTNQD